MAKVKAVKEVKLPKSMAAAADMLYETREKRLAMQKQIDDLEKLESKLKNHLIDNLPKGDATGAQGKVARASIVTKVKPVVQDWDKFYAYVKKNNAFELLHKRLSDGAVTERWENKKEVPGVGRFNAITVSLNKV